jgi:hypothetical protein
MISLARSEGNSAQSFIPSLAFLKLRGFSREAAAAGSCGRQPAEKKTLRIPMPRSGDSNVSRRLLSPLRGSKGCCWSFFRGLTPTATCCCRFATPEKHNFKTGASG